VHRHREDELGPDASRGGAEAASVAIRGAGEAASVAIRGAGEAASVLSRASSQGHLPGPLIIHVQDENLQDWTERDMGANMESEELTERLLAPLRKAPHREARP